MDCTTKMRYAIHTLFAASLLVGAAVSSGQELPLPPTDADPLAPSLIEQLDEPAADPTPSPDQGFAQTSPYDMHQWQMYDNCPAPVESTGTWFNRGFWFAEAEAVVMVRQWNRKNLVIASDAPPQVDGAGDVVGSDRDLVLGRSTPGREGSVRLTLGRFLFRDSENRDHTLGFTVFGGGEFGQNCRLISDETDTLSISVPGNVDNFAGNSFDGADEMFVQYDSRFNSFELNYTMSTRLDRDRMELLPTGQWVRRVNAGVTYQFIAGLRYLDLTENINWTASSIDSTSSTVNLVDDNGRYDIRTSNDLFGPQMGLGCTYQTARWSIETLMKAGILANDAKSRSGLEFTDPAGADDLSANNFTNSDRSDTLSFVSEFSLVGRYFMRPNIALRSGYHMLYMTEVALAPHQINFNPDDAKVVTSGDPFYHGISFGMDVYW